jgi:Protein of unknown function (DUF1207)
MVNLRMMPALGVMLLPTSFAYATTADDAYIAGYAAGVLKQNLKLDMPSLVVRDGVITLPTGSLQADDQAKAVQLLSEIPGVEAVKVSELTSEQSRAALTQPVQVAGDETVQQPKLPFCLQGFYLKGICSSPYWQIRVGRICPHLTATFRAIILMVGI